MIPPRLISETWRRLQPKWKMLKSLSNCELKPVSLHSSQSHHCMFTISSWFCWRFSLWMFGWIHNLTGIYVLRYPSTPKKAPKSSRCSIFHINVVSSPEGFYCQPLWIIISSSSPQWSVFRVLPAASHCGRRRFRTAPRLILVAARSWRLKKIWDELMNPPANIQYNVKR